MRRPVTLEDFGLALAGGCAATDELGLEEIEAGTASSALAPPAPQEPEPWRDPEAERIEALARIADALEIMAAEHSRLRLHCIGQAATVLGAAAETLLPQLVRDGFASLVADTARVVAEQTEWPRLTIAIAPGEAEALIRFLDDTPAATQVRVDARPSVAQGTAEIAWDDGGAVLDANSMVETVLADYRHRLETLSRDSE